MQLGLAHAIAIGSVQGSGCKARGAGRGGTTDQPCNAADAPLPANLGKSGDWGCDSARFPVFGHDGRVNTAPDVEFGGQPQEPGCRGGDEAIQYLVGYGFVECAAIAVRPDIQ